MKKTDDSYDENKEDTRISFLTLAVFFYILGIASVFLIDMITSFIICSIAFFILITAHIILVKQLKQLKRIIIFFSSSKQSKGGKEE